jgi:pimeloyl-ACP methyl ester carboxylesterase
MNVALDGCQIAYDAGGEGDPIVLIHGLGGSRVLWGSLRPLLERRFHVVALDLRGAGATTETVRRELTLDACSSATRSARASRSSTRCAGRRTSGRWF